MNNVMMNNTETKMIERKNMSGIKKARYFLPLLSTAGWLVKLFGYGIGAFDIIGNIMIIIGVLSALTVCFKEMFTITFVCIAACFKFCRGFIPYYGIADLVAGLVGLMFGGVAGLVVVVGMPAILTIRKYKKRCAE